MILAFISAVLVGTLIGLIFIQPNTNKMLKKLLADRDKF